MRIDFGPHHWNEKPIEMSGGVSRRNVLASAIAAERRRLPVDNAQALGMVIDPSEMRTTSQQKVEGDLASRRFRRQDNPEISVTRRSARRRASNT